MRKILMILLVIMLFSCNRETAYNHFPEELQGEWIHENMKELDVRIGLNSVNMNDQLFMIDSVFLLDNGSYETRMKPDGTLWWKFSRDGELLKIEQGRSDKVYRELGTYMPN